MENNKKPYILISNDDGISAPGIKHLWNALHEQFDVVIVAPNSEKSGAGLSTTMFKALHTFKVKWPNDTVAYRVTGTPTDSIKLALSSLLERKPDLIVSGINRGSNAGRNILYSGTCGCAIEGALRGFPGIAFSCDELDDPSYENFEKYIPDIVNHFLKNRPPFGTFINVTFPEKTLEIKGFKMARQGKSRWFESPDKRQHPEGHQYFWLGGEWLFHEEDILDGDTHLVKQGYITAVPIDVTELTHHDYLEKNKQDFENLYKKF
ncbi:MAG: 5'/3'-nucleotidase SurE [Parachlamydiales bacterium]|nr:5'/3'-nucleotidase SurE [Parachlamydiales bacterium]